MHDSDHDSGGWPPLTVTRRSLLVDGNDLEFRHFVEGLVLFGSRLQELRGKLAAQMQVSPPQYRIVMALARAETPEMTATELAAALEVSTAFIVTETQKLGELGLVSRRRHPHDARSFLIALSPAGRTRVSETAPLMCLVNDALFGSLDRGTMLMLAKQTKELLEASSTALALLDEPQKPAKRVRRSRKPQDA